MTDFSALSYVVYGWDATASPPAFAPKNAVTPIGASYREATASGHGRGYPGINPDRPLNEAYIGAVDIDGSGAVYPATIIDGQPDRLPTQEVLDSIGTPSGPDLWIFADRPSDQIGALRNFQKSDIDTEHDFNGGVICFFAGTLVATPAGERRVERLSIGDRILTANGRTVPVKWLGRQTVSARFSPAERLMPVRIASGALGGGLPHSDLTITADHAMLVDGILCQADAMVNGTTIVRVPLSEFGETYTVYHVETEDHEVIFANGATSETFIDTVSRRAFDNYAEFEALYGAAPPETKELPYPRAMNARQLPAHIKRLLGIGTGGQSAA